MPRKHFLKPDDIIMPYFVVEGRNVKRPIRSMPGIYHLSVDNLVAEIKSSRGIKKILLFGVTHKKDSKGAESYNADGIVQKAVRAVKKEARDVVVMTDVCLCSYTDHGHCRILKAGGKRLTVDDLATLKTLARISLSHADAGADYVAPSAMMKGQVRWIRKALDNNGYEKVRILAYSAKYASNFYWPFRDAMSSAPRFGDRSSYQLDFRDSDEALLRMDRDIKEGADIIMVKPAVPYLDIIYKAKTKFNVPIAAYSVSGEYALIKNYCGSDRPKLRQLVLETAASIKRAGADLIISYFGKDLVKWLR